MKRIFLAVSFFILTITSFSQTGASFKFGDVGSWWIPKVKLFGNSTTLTDSTNYVTLNKGLYVFDSLKVGKWLYVGANGVGGIYLDTANTGQIYFDGFDLTMNNTKSTGSINLTSLNTINLTSDSLILITDRIRITDQNLYYYNINENGISGFAETQQITLASDTASDYTGSDAIVINRQSGVITTKSLTTATDNFYTFTLTNSLISATSKVFLSYCGGTESAGRPMVYRVVSGSGSATCIILNLTGAGSFNGNIKFNFVVFN